MNIEIERIRHQSDEFPPFEETVLKLCLSEGDVEALRGNMGIPVETMESEMLRMIHSQI